METDIQTGVSQTDFRAERDRIMIEYGPLIDELGSIPSMCYFCNDPSTHFFWCIDNVYATCNEHVHSYDELLRELSTEEIAVIDLIIMINLDRPQYVDRPFDPDRCFCCNNLAIYFFKQEYTTTDGIDMIHGQRVTTSCAEHRNLFSDEWYEIISYDEFQVILVMMS